MMPPDVRELLQRERARETKQQRAAWLLERARASEQKRSRALKEELARAVLEWTRAVARRCDLPPRGVEILRLEAGRTSTTVLLLRHGALELRHVVAPFAVFRIIARSTDALSGVPLDVIERVHAAIQSGAIWDHVRRTLEQP